MAHKKSLLLVLVCVILAGVVLFALCFLGAEKEERPAISNRVTTTKVMDTATQAEFEGSFERYQELPSEFGFFDRSQVETIDGMEQFYRATLTQDFSGLFQVRLTAYFLDQAYQNCVLRYLDWSAPASVPIQINPASILGEASEAGGYLLFVRYGVDIQQSGLHPEDAEAIRDLTWGEELFFQESEESFFGFGDVSLLIAPQPFSS